MVKNQSVKTGGVIKSFMWSSLYRAENVSGNSQLQIVD